MKEKEIVFRGRFTKLSEPKRLTIACAVVAAFTAVIFAAGTFYGRSTATVKPKVVTKIVNVPIKVEEEKTETETEITSDIKIENVAPVLNVSDEDIELIALVTMAEAEGECELGQRLVIDTILNRVASEHFPDTVREVVYQPNQFTSMWNGRVDRCYVKEELYKLVRDELQRQVSYDVVFFRTKHYSDYGYPLIQCGSHYFSIYE